MTRPLIALQKAVGKNVNIICKDGIECSGKLSATDEFMNVVLKDAQQKRNGQSEKHEVLLLRGTNIFAIQL